MFVVSPGVRIKQIRKEKGISQKELAERLNIAPNTLSRYECGNRAISLEMIEKIADALNVTIIEIIDQPYQNISDMTQNEIKEFMSKMHNISDVFNQAVQDRDTAYSESSEYIVNYYKMLNKKGRIEATKRTAELTSIEEYTKPDE